MMTEISLFEAIYTQRSIRKFTDEPVSEEAIAQILEAATKAPSAGNRQPWEFIVIRDPQTRQIIGDYYLKAFREYKARVLEQAKTLPAAREQVARWERRGPPDAFAESLSTIPVLILVCLNREKLGVLHDDPEQPGQIPSTYASIYPAVQNMLLAARGLGLGSVLTTLHCRYEQEIKALLGIPDHVQTVALIPIGHPAVRFGPTTRIPVQQLTHYERWGARKEKG
ncbi:MAG: nitroreductase family protein [Nitrospinota bacterium]|nr:MAG: nitroreductase family protein [Nitrospinota bacterium]